MKTLVADLENAASFQTARHGMVPVIKVQGIIVINVTQRKEKGLCHICKLVNADHVVVIRVHVFSETIQEQVAFNHAT